MTLAVGFDAAFCPDPVPATISGQTVQWCEVYIGGSSAFRTWEAAEVDRVSHLAKLPVWVPTPGLDNPRQAANAAVAALARFGVPAFDAPYRALMVDLETGTEPDAPWLATFRSVILASGYDTMPYGSPSWLFGYPSYLGYIVAAPSLERPALYVHAGVAGTQYEWGYQTQGGQVDADVLESDLLPHLGAWG